MPDTHCLHDGVEVLPRHVDVASAVRSERDVVIRGRFEDEVTALAHDARPGERYKEFRSHGQENPAATQETEGSFHKAAVCCFADNFEVFPASGHAMISSN